MSALLYLWANRRLFTRSAFAGVVLFTIVAFVIPPTYEATAHLMPPEQSGGMSTALLGALSAKAGDGLGAIAGDMLNLKNSGAVVIGILHSRTVADGLIDRFDLRKVYSCRKYETARRILERRTDISEDRKSGIITIAVRDRDRRRAAAIAQAYIDEVNWRVAALTTSAAHRERVFLEDRLATVKRDLDSASLELSRFSSRNNTLDPAVQGKAMLEAVAAVQGQLIAAESELKGVAQVYTPNNVRVRTVQARVDELRRQLTKLSGAPAPALAASKSALVLSAAQQRAGAPSNSALVASEREQLSSSQLYPTIRQLPLLGRSYYDLYREVRIQESVFEALTKQYELAKVQEAKEIPTIKVLDEPVAPESKVWPPRTLIVLLGMLATIASVFLFRFARAAWEAIDTADPRRLFVAEITAATARKLRSIGLMGARRRPGFVQDSVEES
jgi:uncharacterized protein involved in exopolysaccharide biosynthesis